MNNDQNNGFNSLYNNNNPKQTINNPFDIIMDDEPEKDTFSNSINIVPLANNKDNTDNFSTQNNFPSQNESNYNNSKQNRPNKNWQNQNNFSNQNQAPNTNFNVKEQPSYINDFQRKDLLMAYVGFKYEKFCRQKINIAALVFAEFYLFYRRMTFFGLLMLISRTLLFVYVNPYISFSINILLAIIFNKIYLYHAKNKINSIEKHNTSLSYPALREKVIASGGTKQSSAVVAFILYLLAIVATLIIVGAIDITTGPLSNFNIFTILGKNPKFDGKIEYEENININKYYQIVMPEEIISSNSNTNITGNIKTNPLDSESNCNYKFNILKDYIDAKDLANQMSKYYKTKKPKELQINSITWYHISYEDNATVNLYLTTRNKRVYMYEFREEKNADSTYCDKYNNSIINSIFYN